MLRELSGVPGIAASLRVAEADGGLACLIQVWPAAELMPAAAVERRRRIGIPGC